jgi:DNA-binding MarR family transcriptional regulator
MTTEESFTRVLRDFTEVFMHRSMRDFKRFMDESGLSASQLNTLMRLYYHGGATDVSHIGTSMGITNAASSQLVDRLVTQGLLVRTEDLYDRRVKQVALSTKGRELIEQGIEARLKWMEELTTALTAEEQAAIIQALTLLNQAARKLDPQSECAGQVEETAPIPTTHTR